MTVITDEFMMDVSHDHAMWFRDRFRLSHWVPANFNHPCVRRVSPVEVWKKVLDEPDIIQVPSPNRVHMFRERFLFLFAVAVLHDTNWRELVEFAVLPLATMPLNSRQPMFNEPPSLEAFVGKLEIINHWLAKGMKDTHTKEGAQTAIFVVGGSYPDCIERALVYLEPRLRRLGDVK